MTNGYRRVVRRWSVVSGLLAICGIASVVGFAQQEPDLPFGALGAGYAPPTLPPVPETIARENGKGGRPTSAAGWRARADSLASTGQCTGAAEAYREAGKIYATKGDPNAAKIMETQAQRYETRASLWVHSPKPERSVLAANYTGKRLEPMYGAYIGAFIDREDGVSSYYMSNVGQKHKSSSEFNEKIGKKHATFLTYQLYGNDFPETWMLHLKANGAAAQWALQPARLSDVQDNEYLRGLAASAAQVGIPIFLRFAAEMNGDWVPYHGDPAEYRRKFQMVARIFHETAPNVAMVWCPNELPETKIDEYYPGPEAVDWVGVNFYSVYYTDNDLSRPSNWRDPSDSLEYVYRKFSAVHPIMIGEFAASHLSTADNKPRNDFATDKIAQLYAALPRRYPRVKAVHWFSMNAIRWAPPGRRMNDYSLLGESAIATAYRKMVQDPYFLSDVQKGVVAEERLTTLADGLKLSGRVTVSAYVKTYVQRPQVSYTINGTPVKTFTAPGDYEIILNTTRLPNGPAKLGLVVKDDQGKVASQQAFNVTIAN